VTNEQLYMALGVPLAANALFFTLLALYINAKIGGLEGKMDTRFDGLIGTLNAKFETVDVRLKHLEGAE
jgi:hypothetical protein